MVKNIYHCLEKKEIVDGRLHCRWEQTNFFVLHSHDFWEMTIGIHGNSQHDINETSVILKPQSAVLITPKHLHKIQPCPKENNHLNIVISDSFMKSCCDHFSPTLYDEFLQMPVIPLYLSNGQFSVIKDFQAKMQILPITDPKKEVIQRMLLSYLIELVYNNNFINSEQFPQAVKDFIHLALLPEYIDLKPATISKITNFSYSYFSRMFKEATGNTLNNFLTDIKMEYAYTQITKTNIPFLELSTFLGYSSLSHFIRLFKKYYGNPPSYFRKTTFNK